MKQNANSTRPLQALWLAVIFFVAASAPATMQAQGFGFSLNGGATNVELAGQSGKSEPMYGLALTYTYKLRNSSAIFSGGIQVYQYSGAGSTDSGKVSMFEIRTPFTFGWRKGVVGYGAYTDYRQGWRTFDNGDGHNLVAFFYGPYLRIGLGPMGSLGGRFALEGRYLWGLGEFQGQAGDTSASSDFHDWRAGASFLINPKWVVRADYADVAYVTDLQRLSQTQKAYLLTIGYVFGGR